MRGMTSVAAAVAVAAALAVGVAGCRATPTTPATAGTPSGPSPTAVRGPLSDAIGTPPTDAVARARAARELASVRMPPGVRVLDAAPAHAPRQPATVPACDWLVRATRWWTTASADIASVKGWITAHPVAGMAVDGAMTGPGQLSAVSERSSRHPEDILDFEFIPAGATTIIRIDVTVVPSGARCASGASGASAAVPHP